MPGVPIPHFDASPAGLAPLRSTILRGVSPIDAIRASKACHQTAHRIRRHMREGKVLPERHVEAEARIVSLMLMEVVLAELCGALRADDRQQAREASHAA